MPFICERVFYVMWLLYHQIRGDSWCFDVKCVLKQYSFLSNTIIQVYGSSSSLNCGRMAGAIIFMPLLPALLRNGSISMVHKRRTALLSAIGNSMIKKKKKKEFYVVKLMIDYLLVGIDFGLFCRILLFHVYYIWGSLLLSMVHLVKIYIINQEI